MAKILKTASLKISTDKINAHIIYGHQETSQRKNLQPNKKIMEKR